MKKFHVLYQSRFGGAVGLVTVEAVSNKDAVAKADAILTADLALGIVNTPIGVVTAYDDGCPMLFVGVQIQQTYSVKGHCTLPSNATLLLGPS